jgi:hypothetical protein
MEGDTEHVPYKKENFHDVFINKSLIIWIKIAAFLVKTTLVKMK